MDDDLLQQGIAALRAGRKAEARALFARVLRKDGQNESAWLWMSGAVETDEDQRRCLMRVLEINPHNEFAKRGLAALADTPSSTPVEAPVAPAPASSPISTPATSMPTSAPVGAPVAPRPSSPQQDSSAAPTTASKRSQDQQSRRLIVIGAVMVAVACVLGFIVLATGGDDEVILEPLYPVPYVIVYGRLSSTESLELMDELEAQDIPFRFGSVDVENVQRQLYPRMRESNLDTESYSVPVVDISGQLMIQPDISTIVELYTASQE